jgi:hypothetical protein
MFEEEIGSHWFGMRNSVDFDQAAIAKLQRGVAKHGLVHGEGK